jgi:hypothetical protein
LVLKSYYSQVSIGVVFVGFGWLLAEDASADRILFLTYWSATLLSFSFLLYGAAYAKAGRLAAKNNPS